MNKEVKTFMETDWFKKLAKEYGEVLVLLAIDTNRLDAFLEDGKKDESDLWGYCFVEPEEVKRILENGVENGMETVDGIYPFEILKCLHNLEGKKTFRDLSYAELKNWYEKYKETKKEETYETKSVTFEELLRR